MGYTKLTADYYIEEEKPIYIVFGDHTRSFNIAQQNFCVADNVKVLLPNVTNNLNVLMFIISSWKKCIENKGYARHWSIAKNVNFKLPIKNGKIDFDFMESFIAELETQRIAELEAYLSVTGLKDYTLTEEEETSLEMYDELNFEEYDVIEIFDVENTGNILSRDIVENSGTTPYLCASAENNAVSSYISYDKHYLNKGNCVFIGGKTFVVTYQKNDFYSNDSHNLALYLKNQEINRFNQLYLATCVYKSLGYKYSWGNSISKTKIKKDKISLPTIDGKPNFKIMKNFISAVQKLVIKDVVLYADEKITATKAVVYNK